MADLKRNTSSLAAMEASLEAAASKKTKTDFGSCQSQLPSSGVQLRRSSHLPDTVISPATSVNSTATVVSEENFSGRLPPSCSSVSNANVETIDAVENSSATVLDLETDVLETEDSSTSSNFKVFRKDRCSLNEFCGDSKEMTTVFPVKPSTDASEHRKFPATKVAPKEEIEEFFAMAEKYEQERFAEKYNYDIVKDMPLQGRYEWVRLI